MPSLEEAVGGQLVVPKSLEWSLWFCQAQRQEAKLKATWEQLDAEQSRVPQRDVMAASALAEIDPLGWRAIPNASCISVERITHVVLVGMDACIMVQSPGCWSTCVSVLEAWHDMGFGKVLDVWSCQVKAHDSGAIWHAARDGPSPTGVPPETSEWGFDR